MLQDTSDHLSGVIALAVDEARGLGHSYLGSEHLLLALAPHEGASTASILAWHDLSPERLRTRVRQVVGSNTTRPPSEMLPLSPAAKRLLELAHEAAAHLVARHVEPSHLLLAIIFDRGCLAGRILGESDANLDEIRSQLIAGDSA